MQPARRFRLSTATLAALGCALVASLAGPLVSPCRADTERETADEAALRADARKTFKEQVQPFVQTYCTKCHGGGRAKANVNLEVDLKDPGRGAAFMHWKKAVANVKVHDMPPEDAAKQPTEEERLRFIGWIGKLKHLSPRSPGPSVIRRLSKVEYANTLHESSPRRWAGRGSRYPGRRRARIPWTAAPPAGDRSGAGSWRDHG